MTIPYFEFGTVWTANWSRSDYIDSAGGRINKDEHYILISAEVLAEATSRRTYFVHLMSIRGLSIHRPISTFYAGFDETDFQKTLRERAEWQQTWTNFRALFTCVT